MVADLLRAACPCVFVYDKPCVPQSAHRVTATKLTTLLKVMRVVNILNGAALGVSCFFAFSVVHHNFLHAFLAVYIG